MARTAKKKSAKVTANQSNAESASKHSSDTDVSELSSSQVSVDFLSDPNAPIEAVYESTPSVSPRESAGTDKEPDASEFPIHSTPIPKASKNKSKAKSNPEQKAKPQEKKTRKQSKPAPRKAHVEKEIRKLQDSVDLLIPKAPFQRWLIVSYTHSRGYFEFHLDWSLRWIDLRLQMCSWSDGLHYQ